MSPPSRWIAISLLAGGGAGSTQGADLDFGDPGTAAAISGSWTGISNLPSATRLPSIEGGSLTMADTKLAHLRSAVYLPDIDRGHPIDSLEVTFQLTHSAGEGHAFSAGACFGAPAGDSVSRRGLASRHSMACMLIRDADGGDRLELYADTIMVASLPIGGSSGDTAPRSHEVTLSWGSDGPITAQVGGKRIEADASRFTASPGDVFAFVATTGGAGCDVEIVPRRIRTSPSPPPATGLIVSEFMADNSDTIEDEDFDSSDWIELYNGSDQPAQLGGWTLSDDPDKLAKWRLPDVEVAPFGHLLLFASGKDRTAAGAPLHTNFKLSKKGGIIALSPPGGGDPISEISYRQQTEDGSFGRAEDGSTGFLATPSPGTRNPKSSAAHAPLEADVLFSEPSGIHGESFRLRLDTVAPPPPDSVVRYTINGTVPHTGSAVYEAPIPIRRDTIVRARVFAPGALPGPVGERSFTFSDPETHTFSSNLPVVVIEPHGNAIDRYSDPSLPRPFQTAVLYLFEPGGTNGRARLADPPALASRAGLHVRGQSSSRFPKKQYAVEFRDADDADRKVSPLGFPAHSDFILHAPYSDKSLIRNRLAYDLARSIGGNRAAMRSQFVEVFHNADGGGLTMADYAGVYLFCERITRGKSRIPVEKLNPLIRAPDKIRGGYIFKKDSRPTGPTFLSPVERQRIEIAYPKRPNDVQIGFLESHIARFENALHRPDFANSGSGYPAFIETGDFILNHLLIEVSRNVDAYGRSSYFFKPRGGKISALPIWDYNLAFGNADFGGAPPTSGWHWQTLQAKRGGEGVGGPYAWYPRLFADPEFERRYRESYRRLRSGTLSDGRIAALTTSYAEELAEAQARNFQRWEILGVDTWPFPHGGAKRQTHAAEIEFLRRWLSERLHWMDGELGR